MLNDVTLEYYPTCERCIEGKMIKRDHSSQVLEWVDTKSLLSYEYNCWRRDIIINFIDYFSKYANFLFDKKKKNGGFRKVYY